MDAILVKVYDNLHYAVDHNFYRTGILTSDRLVVFVIGDKCGHLYMTGVKANTPLPFQLTDGRIVSEIDRTEISNELLAMFEVFKKANLILQDINKTIDEWSQDQNLFDMYPHTPDKNQDRIIFEKIIKNK